MDIKSTVIKSKNWIVVNEDRLVFLVAFLLIGAICFGLGILWQKDQIIKAPIIIEKGLLATDSKGERSDSALGEIGPLRDGAKKSVALANIYVASKKGRYYHLPDCPGAKAIKEGNKIGFNTTDEAERAGYKPAQNCKGLITNK